MRSSSRLLFALACGLMACLLAAPPRPAAGGGARTVYLPTVVRGSVPIGFVTRPSELRATRALAARGIEPGRSAVDALLDKADKAMRAAPCAVAYYTTSAVRCLNTASEYSYVLALAYHITGDGRYGDKAAAFIRAWTGTLTAIDAADDQPQLDWSRMIPAMIWGADLLEGTPIWSAADRQRFRAMLIDLVLPKGRQAARRWNNWADAGNLLRLSIAVYAGLPDERAAAVTSWKQRLDGQRQPDGSWKYGMLPDGSLDEENRRAANGLSYNQRALSLKTVFAEIMRRQGDTSLYAYRTPRGVGLRAGWTFLAPQVLSASAGQCAWPYTPDHCVDYASISGWEIAYAYWHDPAYLGPIQLHRPFPWSDWADPGYSTLLFGSLTLND